MKHLLPFLISFSLFGAQVTAQPLMRDVFAAMPDSILPMVTKNNRLDCIDFIENNMEAKVRNVADEYVTLEALTRDYALFRTSAASVMELKLLPTSDTTAVLCVITTAQAGEPGTPRRMEDSNIRFFQTDWQPLLIASAQQPLPADSSLSKSSPSLTQAVSSPIPSIPLTAFLKQDVAPSSSSQANALSTASSSAAAPSSVSSETFDRAWRSLQDFHPVRLSFSPEAPTLTAILQTAYLATDEREAVTPHLQPVHFRWDGHTFVRQQPVAQAQNP